MEPTGGSRKKTSHVKLVLPKPRPEPQADAQTQQSATLKGSSSATSAKKPRKVFCLNAPLPEELKLIREGQGPSDPRGASSL